MEPRRKMSHKRGRSASPIAEARIFKSSPIIDRSSRFIAYFSASLSAKELQAQGEIGTATHRIAAWRRPSSQRVLISQHLFDSGHDDDGEKYGGKTLEKVMSIADVEGAIVVARWYGGVMLGPVRFDHMKACAQEAISGWTQERDKIIKRRKVQEDVASRERLIQSLPERDNSILVLRGLLTQKVESSSSGTNSGVSPTKVPHYGSLPLPALEKLEKVRDATIAWILGAIKKAESTQTNCEEQDARLGVAAMPGSPLPDSWKDTIKDADAPQSHDRTDPDSEKK